jgi:hypothetical protein
MDGAASVSADWVMELRQLPEFPFDAKESPQALDALRGALTQMLIHIVPRPAALPTVVPRDDDQPIIVARQDAALYLIDVESFRDNEYPHVRVVREMLNPETVTIAASGYVYSEEGALGLRSSILWTIRLPTFGELKLHAELDERRMEEDPQHSLALGIAQTLGWDAPLSGRP